MKIINCDVIHIRSLYSLFNEKIEYNKKVDCVIKSYNQIKIAFLTEPEELDELSKIVKSDKDTFYIFVFQDEYHSTYLEHINESKNFSVFKSLYQMIVRSYFFYVLKFNKGIKTYVANNKDMMNDLLSILTSVVIISAKKSGFYVNFDMIKEMKLIIAFYLGYCIFGYNSLSQMLQFGKKIGLSISDKAKIVLFYPMFKDACKKNKPLGHILAMFLNWENHLLNIFYINVNKFLGSTLMKLFFVCGSFESSFEYKMTMVYYLYSTKQIEQEVNISSLNKITDFAFSKFLKQVDKLQKLGYFGKCTIE